MVDDAHLWALRKTMLDRGEHSWPMESVKSFKVHTVCCWSTLSFVYLERPPSKLHLGTGIVAPRSHQAMLRKLVGWYAFWVGSNGKVISVASRSFALIQVSMHLTAKLVVVVAVQATVKRHRNGSHCVQLGHVTVRGDTLIWVWLNKMVSVMSSIFGNWAWQDRNKVHNSSFSSTMTQQREN